MIKRFAWVLFLVTAVIIVFTLLTGCGKTPATTNADKAKATQSATIEDAQLAKDGYSPFHVPGFGKADVGVKGHEYELVVDGGKLSQQVVYSADKKPQPGVTFKVSGPLVVANADSLSHLKDALKTVTKGL